MRTRLILRLAHDLRCTHQKTKSWRVTAAVCNVRDPHGEPSPGLAKLIAHHRYSPSPDLFRRLLHDGAIKLPKPRPLPIGPETRRAIVRALEERKPLPPPSEKTRRAFDEWLRRP